MESREGEVKEEEQIVGMVDMMGWDGMGMGLETRKGRETDNFFA